MWSLRPLVPALFLLASPAFGGWSMTQVTRTTGDDPGMGDSTQRVSLEGSSAKVEMMESANPMMEAGSYLLVQDGGRKMFLVNPDAKTYARFDPMAIASGSEAMAGSGFETKIEDPRVVKVLEEPGGEILGHPTTHYRYRTTYTTVTSMAMGVTMSTAMDVVEDIWTAPAIDAGTAARAVADAGGSGGMRQELDELESTVKATLVGLPLRQVTVTKSKTATEGKGFVARMMMRGAPSGEEGTTTTTIEVRDLVEAALPASTFQIPAGYAETEIMQRGPAMPDLGGERRLFDAGCGHGSDSFVASVVAVQSSHHDRV
jgi:hypothetical protein